METAVAAARGYTAMTKHAGHGIGLTWEAPWIMADDDTVLQEGMVLAVEPGVYWEGGGGLRVEDNFLVTADGLEKLSAFPDGVVRCP